ncbi:MAG: hypothetical protein EP343_18155 [Deltaproteobacteria bacterium]|nr:MAG: hypothetical protein EP343_18155 [Deltaproteobacteria bacterium]
MSSVGTHNAFRLFLLGFVTLFLELLLIRYLGGNIWNLGYFPNLVLLAVFIGMGLGFVFHHLIPDEKSMHWFGAGILLLGLLIVVVTFAHPSLPGFAGAEGNLDGDLYFTATMGNQQSSFLSLLMFLVWFGLIVFIFFGISQQTAKTFRLFTPLKAYTLDIAGSCAGIVSFMLISWFRIPAYYWFVFLVPLIWLAAPKLASALSKAALVGVLIVCAGLAFYQDNQLLYRASFKGKMESYWSPYQKVEFTNTEKSSLFQRQIFVNGIFHQRMDSVKTIRRNWYNIPYFYRKQRKLPPYKNVLIIGAGSGNDVSVALLNGVEHVDAVEIDPIIAALGKKYHPYKPYSNPKVTLTITDGRAFMTNTHKRFDLIIFALTDSLVKVSPMAQLRLENYLFTQESVNRALSLLRPQGELMLYNYYRKQWLKDKIAKMLYKGTGNKPKILMQNKSLAVFLAGKHLKGKGRFDFSDVSVPTDDWPFLYLKNKRLPSLYLSFIVFLSSFVLLLLMLLERSSAQDKERPEAHSSVWLKTAFVFMGVAFLLLETKSIIQFSLLFGTTWVNNSLVFLAVLVSVLAANWVAVVLPRSSLNIIFVLLFVSCLLVLVFPLSNLLSIDNQFLRFALASLMTFSPIFFANLIFSMSFRDVPVAEHIFGWNLLGATLGGAVEYLSLVTGYNALAWVVVFCYAFTFLCLWFDRRHASAPSQTSPA